MTAPVPPVDPPERPDPEPISGEAIEEGLRLVRLANAAPDDPAAYGPWNAWKFANAWALLVEVAAIRNEVSDA